MEAHQSLPQKSRLMMLGPSRENSLLSVSNQFDSGLTSARDYIAYNDEDDLNEREGDIVTRARRHGESCDFSDDGGGGGGDYAESMVGYAESVCSITSIDRTKPQSFNTPDELHHQTPLAIHNSRSRDSGDCSSKRLTDIAAARVEDDVGIARGSSKRILYDSLKPSYDSQDQGDPFISVETTAATSAPIKSIASSAVALDVTTGGSPISTSNDDYLNSPNKSKPPGTGPGSSSIKSRLYRNQISNTRHENNNHNNCNNNIGNLGNGLQPILHTSSSGSAGNVPSSQPITPSNPSKNNLLRSSLSDRSENSSIIDRSRSDSKPVMFDRLAMVSMSTSQFGLGQTSDPSLQQPVTGTNDRLLHAISQEEDVDYEPIGDLPHNGSRSRSSVNGLNELDRRLSDHRIHNVVTSKPKPSAMSNGGFFNRWGQWLRGIPYRLQQDESGKGTGRVAPINSDHTHLEDGSSAYASGRSTNGSASMRSIVIKTSLTGRSAYSTQRTIASLTARSLPQTHMNTTETPTTSTVLVACADVHTADRLPLLSGGSTQLGDAVEVESSSTRSNALEATDGFATKNPTSSPGKDNEQTNSKRSVSSHESAMRNKIAELDKPQGPAQYEYHANMLDIWAYCITTVIGGIFYGWNAGLDAGFGSYAVAQVLVGLSFLVLGCSLAEIMSTVSFSGGAYGMARVVLGFYVGFIIAVFELFEYLTYTAVSAQYIGELFCDKLNVDLAYTPLFSLGFYFVAAVFVLESNSWFWRLNLMLALISLAIILIYCFGTLGFVHFSENASLHQNFHHPRAMKNWFSGGMFAFMHSLPFTTWGFGGLESVALVGDMTDNPRVNLSYGMAYGSLTLFVCTIFIMFVACSLPPGLQDFYRLEYFMDNGFQLMGINANSAEWLVFPAQFAMAYGFILPSSKLLRAIVTSKLVPSSIFSYVANESQMSRLSIIYVLILSYLFCLIGIYVPSVDFENIPILLAQFTYITDLYAFYKLRTDFSNRENKFRSPFGIFGAALSAFMFFLVAIAVLGFQHTFETAIYLVSFLVVLTLYYFGYAKTKQHFSDEEQKSLLVLHVIRNNNNKKKKKLGHNHNHNNIHNGSSNNILVSTIRSISTKISSVRQKN